MEQPYGPARRPGYNLALASLIVGAVGLLASCCAGFFVLPLGVVAIVLGVMAMNAESRAGNVVESSRTIAIIGIVLGSVACLIGVVVGIMHLAILKNIPRDQWPTPGSPGFPRR
jgi:hypothetical protein